MNTEQFYLRVEQLLKEYCWSRNRLAKESKVPKSTIYNMMRDRNEPKLETFFEIIDGFHIPLGKFVNPETDEKEYTTAQIELLKLTEGFYTSQYERVLAYAQAVSQEPKK